ncbi:MAG TPA: flavin reductase family protein [bacterium]|nr:flavin reductase family protein [bacterium]
MDEQTKKQVLKMFTYGMFIFTAGEGDEIAASSVTWVTQCSFQPPLVAVGLRTGGGPYHIVRQSGIFALHIVPAGEKELASSFFRAAQVRDDRLNGYTFQMDAEHGVPVLDAPPAYLICRVREIPELGDHHLVIAEVVDAQLRTSADPMVLRDTGWSYGG